MTDHSRPEADEPGVLELMGFSASQAPPHARGPVEAPPAASTRREARAREGRTSGKSPQRRIRAVQKGYARKTRPDRTGRPAARGTSRARTIGSRVLSIAAMVFAGALAVGMSVPANAFGDGSSFGSQLLSAATGEADKAQPGQSLDVASTVTGSSAARDEYTVTSWAEMLRLQYGTRDYSYEMGDPNGPIRWPFPYAVPISSGFGERASPCRGCSSIHMGIDLTPGSGAPIYAVASGTVVEAEDNAYGFGNHVIIDHGNLLGDGNDIRTLYAHMQHGSTDLKVGDQVQVGDFIGLVGMTGAATGPHLHLEVHVSGVQVDPFAWLKANT